MKKRIRKWADADVQRAERAAVNAFDFLELAHPTEASIEAIAYVLGAVVRDLPMRGAVGRLTRLQKHATISVSTSVQYPGRRRWTIAHEIGHLKLHANNSQMQLIVDETLEEQYDQGDEREANAFAGAFLMPSKLWQKHVDVKKPTLGLVRELAHEYQVSFQASAIRFVKMSPERCAIAFCQENQVRWFALGDDFGHWIQRGMKLDPYTLAYDYFAKGKVPDRPEAVSASAWLSADSSRRLDDEEIIEDCSVIPSLQATLSLLWIPLGSDL